MNLPELGRTPRSQPLNSLIMSPNLLGVCCSERQNSTTCTLAFHKDVATSTGVNLRILEVVGMLKIGLWDHFRLFIFIGGKIRGW